MKKLGDFENLRVFVMDARHEEALGLGGHMSSPENPRIRADHCSGCDSRGAEGFRCRLKQLTSRALEQ